METAERQQTQAKEAAEEAQRASQRALQQAAQLQQEQSKTAQQMEELLSAQVSKAQETIEGATKFALQTQKDVKTLSDVAHKAEYTAQITALKVEDRVKQLTMQIEEQKAQSLKDAQSAQEAQKKIAEQLEEAQKVVQSTAGVTQKYETQLTELTRKMQTLEQLLVKQRMQGTALESELSAAQDRIGGAERRAQQLEQENQSIRTELNYWNEYYSQETETTGLQGTQAEVENPAIPSMSAVSSGLSISVPMSESSAAVGNIGETSTIVPPWARPVLSSNVTTFDNLNIGISSGPTLSSPILGRKSFDPPGYFTQYEEVPPFTRQQSGRRESFGSVFPCGITLVH